MSSINNGIPFVPENTIDPAAGLNESINIIDALLQLRVVSVGANTPPVSPANGARYIVGTAPTGAWAGRANKLARWLDSVWTFFDAVIAVNQTDGAVWVRQATTWAALTGGGGGMTNPMTSPGDLIVGAAAGAPARLAIGAEGQVPVVRSGVLTYENQSGIDGWDAKLSPAISAGVLTLNLASPAGFIVSLDQDVTSLTFSGAPSDRVVVFTVKWVQDGTGGRAVTWPASVQGAPSQPSPSAGDVTIQSFYTDDGGTTVYQAPMI